MWLGASRSIVHLISLLPEPEENARRKEANEGRPGDEIERDPPRSGATVHASLANAHDFQAAAYQEIVNASFVVFLQRVLAWQQKRVELIVGIPGAES